VMVFGEVQSDGRQEASKLRVGSCVDRYLISLRQVAIDLSLSSKTDFIDDGGIPLLCVKAIATSVRIDDSEDMISSFLNLLQFIRELRHVETCVTARGLKCPVQMSHTATLRNRSRRQSC
jgi:hypothetical protein